MQEMPTGVVMRKKSGDEKEFVLDDENEINLDEIN